MNQNGSRIPHDSDTELSVLSSMFRGSDDSYFFLGKLRPEHFHTEAHRNIFLAIKNVVEETGFPDMTQVFKCLNGACKASFLASVLNFPIAVNRGYHVQRLMEMEAARKLVSKSLGIVEEVGKSEKPIDDILDDAKAEIGCIEIDSASGETARTIMECINLQCARLESKKNPGLKTGFHDLDEYLIGFEPGDLAIIAGRPSMGKTAFALDMARNLAKEKPGLIQSIEMPESQLTDRLIGAEAGVGSVNFRKRIFSQEDWLAIGAAQSVLAERPIVIDDAGDVTLSRIQVNAMKSVHQHKIKWMVIDYLQLISGTKGRSRDEDVGDITRGLKKLAKKLGIVIILLCQLNRKCEERPLKKPMLSDLRESGSIEQDADEVLLLWRGEYYFKDDPELAGKAEINLAKNRNGPTGTVVVGFEKNCSTFFNLAAGREQEEAMV